MNAAHLAMSFTLLRQGTVKLEKKVGNHFSTLLLIFLLWKDSFRAQENVYMPPVPLLTPFKKMFVNMELSLSMTSPEHLCVASARKEEASPGCKDS